MEIDREVLMHIIDSRVSEGIRKWYQDWILPLHKENKEEMQSVKATLATLVEALNKAQGGVVVAEKGLKLVHVVWGGLIAAGMFVLGHIWK